MGLSIAYQSCGTLKSETIPTQDENELEGLTLEETPIEQELLNELGTQGSLQGKNQIYTFVLDQKLQLPKSLTDYVSDMHCSQDSQILEPKQKENPLSLKENLINQKESKIFKSHQQHVEQSPEEQLHGLLYKTHATAHRSLEKAELPQSIAYLKQTPALMQQQIQARKMEHQIQKALHHKEQHHTQEKSSRETKEAARAQKENEKEPLPYSMQELEKKEKERDKDQQQHRKREEEEGFAEGQQDRQYQQDDEAFEGKKCSVTGIDEGFRREFDKYAAEESILSEILNMRVSQFDVLILFMEILKLEIRSREQEKIARRQERELQLLHMQKVVENYKSQANWLMMSSLGSGLLGIFSGICPIVGHLKGKWIMDMMGNVSKKFQTMDKDMFFKKISKIAFTMSEMLKSTGQIHQTFSEGDRNYDQHMSDLHRADWEENTRSLDDIKDSWKGIENFLYQALQMYHDAVRQLYNH